MFSDDAIRKAGHAIYSSFYADVADELEYAFYGDGDEITHLVPEIEDSSRHDHPIWRLLGLVEQSWGVDPWLVFYHLGINDKDEQADALYRLLMNVLGHGIALSDDYDLEPVAIKLRFYPNHVPFADCMFYRDLAEQLVPQHMAA